MVGTELDIAIFEIVDENVDLARDLHQGNTREPWISDARNWRSRRKKGIATVSRRERKNRRKKRHYQIVELTKRGNESLPKRRRKSETGRKIGFDLERREFIKTNRRNSWDIYEKLRVHLPWQILMTRQIETPIAISRPCWPRMRLLGVTMERKSPKILRANFLSAENRCDHKPIV